MSDGAANNPIPRYRGIREAINSIIEIIDDSIDDKLSSEFKSISTNVVLDEQIDTLEELKDYLFNTNGDSFRIIINNLIKLLNMNNTNIKLVNSDGEDPEFEEL